MKVKVVGPHRTGSTIIQNIGFYIIKKKKGRLPKNHKFEHIHNVLYLVTIRDPREMVISLKKNIIDGGKKNIKITDLNFLNHYKIKSDLEHLVKIYNSHKNSKNSLILKFEHIYPDGFGKYDYVINKICNFLDIELSEDELNELNELLDYKKLKSISDTISTFEKNDVDTTAYGLHGNHISSEKIKTWNEIVDIELHDKFNKELSSYIEETDYKI